MFVLSSDISIGTFRCSGVHSVQIRRSLYSIADIATIKLPSIARIINEGKSTPESVVTGRQFKEGDPVTIRLGYNGEMQTEFSGFVKRCNLNMPLEVECEGYSWLLRRNTITKFWKTVTVKELLEKAVSGIPDGYKIDVKCDVDLELSNVNINSLSGFDIIEQIYRYTDGNVSCCFIEPNILWCGFVVTPYANGIDKFNIGAVNYRLGYNVIKNNSLKERSTENGLIRVKYTKRIARGEVISGVSNVFTDFTHTYNRITNHVKDASALARLANEKAYRLNYAGYDGGLQSFLQPFVAPGYLAQIVDNRYPEKNGQHLIESTEVSFGVYGARRMIEIGPKVGFANKA